MKSKLQFKSPFRNRNKNNTKQSMNLACMKIAFKSGYQISGKINKELSTLSHILLKVLDFKNKNL